MSLVKIIVHFSFKTGRILKGKIKWQNKEDTELVARASLLSDSPTQKTKMRKKIEEKWKKLQKN